MNEILYKEQALTTMKPHDSVALAIADWCLGLNGETAEVLDIFTEKFTTTQQGLLWSPEDRMNLAKELGDILWYTVALSAELNLPFENTFESIAAEVPVHCRKQISCIFECLQLAVEAGYTAENIKHNIAHKEELRTDLIQQAVNKIWQYVHLLSVSQGFTILEVADLNVAKLQHRYMSKENKVAFDFDASKDRHAQEELFTDTTIYADLFKKITRVDIDAERAFEEGEFIKASLEASKEALETEAVTTTEEPVEEA